MPLRALLGLIVCNLIWSSSPAFFKILLQNFHPVQTAWLRYFAAFLAFLVWKGVGWGLKRGEHRVRVARISRVDLGFCFLAGFFTFCMSPVLQASGLTVTQAMDGALI